MEYRRLPKGTEEISVIGFGGSGLHQAGEKAGTETVLAAMEHGVNYFDMAVSEAAAFKSYRAAFAGRREQVYLQMHFGADYSSGQYGWTTDVQRIRRGMDWLLRELDTDYIDFGFIHCEVSFPCKAEQSDGRDRRIFWKIGKTVASTY